MIEFEQVTKRYDKDVVAVNSVNLSVQDGEFFALLGPSGCGKSTTLRLIAGLETPDEGTIRLRGEIVADQHRWMPPDERSVGMVFQDYALFPHLTVEANIAFGINGSRRDSRNTRVHELAEMASLTDVLKRFPHQLSGGQQQRVALARALAVNPNIVLLDEPFSNLDAMLREATRTEVRNIVARSGATAILVTHDQEEALSLADRVAVMFDGSIAQMGSPREIYHQPVNPALAGFVGAARLIAGDAEGESVRCPLGCFRLHERQHGRVRVLVRPDTLEVTPDENGSARVVETRFHGAYQLVTVGTPDGSRIEVRAPSRTVFRRGDLCRLTADAPVIAYS